MGRWVDYSERLQMNLALVKKCLSDAGVEPWLQSIRYGTILDSDKSEWAEKSCLPFPLSDKPLERLYGELMVKHMEDAVAIFKYAISKGHVQRVMHQAGPDEVFIRFSDDSTLQLTEPIPSRIIDEIWEESCKWEGRKLGERLKEIDREYEKERKESMNTKQMITEDKLIQRPLHHRQVAGRHRDQGGAGGGQAGHRHIWRVLHCACKEVRRQHGEAAPHD